MTTDTAIREGWGPDGKRGAFSLTFDNFGEAADIELGFFPENAPLGKHFTAEYLPTLLQTVQSLPVTYFIEASNVALYPEQIKSIRDAGHEIAMHAWRHENWGRQDAAQRQDILRRSMQAWETLDIVPRGFRPPGGVMPEGSVQELLDCGLSYCSPLGAAGDTGVTPEGLATLPFAWHHVDAYMLDPRLGALRTAFGDPAEPVSFEHWEAVIDEAVQLALQGRHVSIIFHPFFFGPSKDMSQALRGLISTLQSQRDLWVAPCGEVAQWLRHRS
ncbi:MAG: polysaccharide deacetylase family protein [Burkholderiaceae bacterium]